MSTARSALHVTWLLARDPEGVLFRETVAEQADRHDLSGVVDDLLARTHKRAYLAVVRAGRLRVVLERGMQGMPKLPGMRPGIEDDAHALALGKVVLALEPAEAVERYFCGLAAPILDHRRRFLGAAGISMSRHAFDTERAQLEETLRDVVRFQPSAELREVLDRGPEPNLASAAGTV